MSQATLDISVVDNPKAKRFEAHADGDLLGVIDYIPLDGKVIATHTEVRERYEGRGIASQLVEGALAQLRADGRFVQPQCSYVRRFLAEHPEYGDVVDPDSPY
jgi:uncharacterized protein